MSNEGYAPKPATDELIEQLRKAATEYAAGISDSEGNANLWGLNLTSFMGERMGTVLARLDAVTSENERLRAGVIAAARELYAIEIHRQLCAWDDDLTERLIAVQHQLAAVHSAQDSGA